MRYMKTRLIMSIKIEYSGTTSETNFLTGCDFYHKTIHTIQIILQEISRDTEKQKQATPNKYIM